MFNRLHAPWMILAGSVALVAGLSALLLWKEKPDERPLVLFCAPAVREPMEEIIKLYEEQTGQKVVVTYGPSESILTQMELSKQGDLFFPADESYIDKAQKKGLLGNSLPVARMHAILVVNPNFPKKIEKWADLVSGDVRIAQASSAAAIGFLTANRLEPRKWQALKARTTYEAGNVSEVAAVVQIGAESKARSGNRIDAGIVWNAMQTQKSCQGLKAVRLPELDAVTASVKIAVVAKSGRKKEASDFATFVATSCRDIWAKHGYEVDDAPSGPKKEAPAPSTSQETPKAVGEARPEIVLYAGAMLRPAIEETIVEFEKREGVKINYTYNGCGILVSQMKAGKTPDVYFACDTSFMNQVEDLFEKPTVVSKNQLVIAVPKGNPKGIKSLIDLGRPGLKVGVGHEQQCALGAITRGVFIRSKVYKSVMENVKVQSPTGDLLVNQLRVGALDAVVAYISNVKPYDDLEAIKVEEVNCKPAQPIAISRSTAHPDVTNRLLQALESAQSRERFEKLGFGWEVKP
jgi:molybdenum ABC transporter molybdate-binding protein